ncbi:6-bladed beta-propeller [Prolixibacteraceae bacterium]|nr:6-bladed beta-propeller [Prolixibacteraceae bacterium]
MRISKNLTALLTKQWILTTRVKYCILPLMVIASFVFGGCSQEKIGEYRSVYVNTSDIKYKSLLNQGEFIVLETGENSVIGNIDKLLCFNNKIYILDREITKSIFIYDQTGKLISKISNQGKGPGEYLMPDDFIVDEQTGQVWILDMDQSKVLCFEGSVFKREMLVENEFCFFEKTGENIIGINDYCMNENDCFGVLAFDSELTVKRKFAPFERNDERISWDLQKPLYKNHNGIYITEAFSNVIYRIDHQLNYSPYLTIDFGKDGFEVDKNKVSRDEFLAKLSKTKKAFLVDNFMINKELVFFTFYKDQTLIHCFIDKQKKDKILMVQSLQDTNKIVYHPIYLDQNNMYFTIKASNILDRYPDFQNKFGPIDKFSNPILFKVPSSEIVKLINK